VRSLWLRVLLAATWLTIALGRAEGQTVYAGAGVGPTPVLDGRDGNRNWFGVAGYRSGHAFGGRLSGAETASRLWLSAEAVYHPGKPERVVRPYGLLGVGVAIDFNDTDPILTTGVGARARLSRLFFAFAETRLLAIPGSAESGPRVLAPITFGLGLGH
jgi:hypothetical protein